MVGDLKAKGLLESVEDREIEIGHSDRSKTPIEPYLSKQWFVRMNDVPGGITCGAGTKKDVSGRRPGPGRHRRLAARVQIARAAGA